MTSGGEPLQERRVRGEDRGSIVAAGEEVLERLVDRAHRVVARLGLVVGCVVTHHVATRERRGREHHEHTTTEDDRDPRRIARPIGALPVAASLGSDSARRRRRFLVGSAGGLQHERGGERHDHERAASFRMLGRRGGRPMLGARRAVTISTRPAAMTTTMNATQQRAHPLRALHCAGVVLDVERRLLGRQPDEGEQAERSDDHARAPDLSRAEAHRAHRTVEPGRGRVAADREAMPGRRLRRLALPFQVYPAGMDTLITTNSHLIARCPCPIRLYGPASCTSPGPTRSPSSVTVSSIHCLLLALLVICW